MPHRKSSTSDDGACSYSDFEVHNVEHSIIADVSEQNSFDLTDEQQFEITERGLDNDELAELSHMRVMFYSQVRGSTSGSPGVGNIHIDAGAGFNLADGEYIKAARSSDQAGDGFDVFTGSTDEPGQLWTASWSQSGPLSDNTNGLGAGSHAPHEVEWIDYRQKFENGPFVDAVDNFTTRINADGINLDADVAFGMNFQLYYDVQEREDCRARFGL